MAWSTLNQSKKWHDLLITLFDCSSILKRTIRLTNYLEKYCIRVTSSEDESLCQHVKKEKGPSDFAGGDITINHNGVKIATIERGFQEFIQCWYKEDFDVSNDEFQMQSSNGNGTCITSLSINGNQLLVGKNNDQQSFWIDRNNRYCSNDFMSSSQITIKNGQVDSSDCKPLYQDGVIYYSK